jgi:hypothetical protein
MRVIFALLLGVSALQILSPHGKGKRHGVVHQHPADEDDVKPAKQGRTRLHKHKEHTKLCLLQPAFLQGGAGDPYCAKGVASHDLSACCQKDCGECSDVSDVCKNKATNGRGSTCCPAEINAAKASCADGQAPCKMMQADHVSLQAPGKENAAWDCNKAIPDEMMRQRVAMDYLRNRDQTLNPAGEDLDCDIREVHSVEDLALACEKRDGCGGFTSENGEPKCMLGWTEPKAQMTDAPGTDTYIRAVDREGFVFHYEVSEWGACSVTCGTGKQTRTLFCRNEYGTDYDLSHCQGLYSAGGAPPAEQVCNDFACNCEEGQSVESNGLTVNTGIVFTYDTSPTLSCNGENTAWTGDLSVHCGVWEAGTISHTSGTCHRTCLADMTVESNGATVLLHADLIHDHDRTIPCPSGFTGELKVACSDGDLSIAEGQEPCRAKCLAGDILKAVTVDMGGEIVNPYPVINFDMVHTDTKELTCPSGSVGSWKFECDDGDLTAEGSCFYVPTLVEGDYGNWGELSCNSGMHVISGGCAGTSGNKYIQANRPNDAGTGWICGGNGGNKKIWAMCSHMPVKIVRTDGGDWHKAECPSGTIGIGGGCDAHASPHLVQFAGVVSDMSGYECGGNGGSKTSWAICAHDDGHYSRHELKSRTGDGEGNTQCHEGEIMVGGGCEAYESPHKFQYNGPFKPINWKCAGDSGKKVVFTTCHEQKVRTGCAIEPSVNYMGAHGDQDVGEALNGVDTVDKCCDQCNNNPSCEYFVFTGSVCYLKKNYQWKEVASGSYVSGLRAGGTRATDGR